MNGAVRAGVRAALGRGARAVLITPGDIPLVQPADLELATEAVSGPRVVVVGRDRQGVGTNALLLRPPSVIRPAFGLDSARHHLYLARVSGVPTLEVTSPRLGFDVDHPADLAELRLRHPGGATGALLAHLREHGPKLAPLAGSGVGGRGSRGPSETAQWQTGRGETNPDP